MTSLYVHVPYCEQKCFYCAFNSKAGSQTEDRKRFVEGMIAEIRRRPVTAPLSTIYVGGGTPSTLEPELLGSLLDAIRSHFGLTPDYEWTVEVNPGTAVASIVPVLKAYGVNRVSMGVQTMDPERLKEMGRIHTPGDVVEAVHILRAHGIPRFNLDLIYGQPGQTLQAFDDDLSQLLALHPTHLSLYCLQYEEGTVYTKRKDEGRYVDAAEELAASMFDRAVFRLRQHHIEWYEVSNFAQSGHESRHNMVYWKNCDYQAVGPGAYGREGNIRYTEWHDVPRWIDGALLGTGVRESEEILGPKEDALDMLTSGLRTREGIRFSEIRSRTGIDVVIGHEARLAQWVERGLAELDGDRLRLNERGVLVLDHLLLPFYETVATS